jgi:hypothetical protein
LFSFPGFTEATSPKKEDEQTKGKLDVHASDSVTVSQEKVSLSWTHGPNKNKTRPSVERLQLWH